MDTEFWNSMVPELTVTNFSKSLEFYTTIIGFSVCFTRQSPDFAYITLGKAQLMLEALHDSGWNTAEMEYPLGRGVNFQIEVTDINSIYASLKERGIEFYRDLSRSTYAVGDQKQESQWEFLVKDPDGYLLRFCQIDEQ